MVESAMKQVLLYFAVLYDGDYEKIFTAISEKAPYDKTKANQYVRTYEGMYVTIIDEDYPATFKKIQKPPFIIFSHNGIVTNKPSKLNL